MKHLDLPILAMVVILLMPACQREKDERPIPLTVGNYWTYEYTVYFGRFTSSDTVTALIIGDTTVSIDGESFQAVFAELTVPDVNDPTNQRWLFYDGEEGTYSLGWMSSVDTLVHRTLYFRWPIQTGDKWSVPLLAYKSRKLILEEDSLITKFCIYTSKAFDTPLGTYDCYVYASRIDVWGYLYYLYEYLVPGVGLVGLLLKDKPGGEIRMKIVLCDYHVN